MVMVPSCKSYWGSFVNCTWEFGPKHCSNDVSLPIAWTCRHEEICVRTGDLAKVEERVFGWLLQPVTLSRASRAQTTKRTQGSHILVPMRGTLNC